MFNEFLAEAKEADKADALAPYRGEYYIPQLNGRDAIYLVGNSLGLQPKSVKTAIEAELEDWAQLGVEGHFEGRKPWFGYHHFFKEKTARLVGAKPHEVVVMNSLTVNLHLMLISFYQPHGKRRKIIMEGGAFPSDYYAIESQIRLHDLDVEECMIDIQPRPGEHTLRTEDILQTIVETGEELALVLLGGVNYYTGQAFEMPKIAAAAHAAGAYCGFDLAHAAGNLELQLHDWDIDFAAWCTYKYLNSGPGGTSGVFVHERFADRPDLKRLAGWWGHDEESRFLMKKGFKPGYGAQGWQLSNAQVLSMAAHGAALDIFDRAGMSALRQKSEQMTSFMYKCLNYAITHENLEIEIITPGDPAQRGAQLSLLTNARGRKIFEYLRENGVIADWREPNVIRVAPVPMYNTFVDCFRFVEILREGCRKS